MVGLSGILNIESHKKEQSSNKVLLGDCLEVMPKVIEDKSIDLILCDLPYGTTNCKWDSVIDLKKLWKEYERVIKDNGAIILFAQTPFDKVLGASNLKLLRYELIWEKTSATGFLNAKKMPLKAHENILIFYKKLPTYNPQKTNEHKRKIIKSDHHKQDNNKGEIYNDHKNYVDYDSTERYPRSVLRFKKDTQKSKLHPTQKPLALIEYLIKTYSNEGDLVLDNTAGSGTTGVGAKNLNRKFILIEKDPKYHNIAKQRIKK